MMDDNITPLLVILIFCVGFAFAAGYSTGIPDKILNTNCYKTANDSIFCPAEIKDLERFVKNE